MVSRTTQSFLTGLALVGVTTLGLLNGSARAQSFPCGLNDPFGNGTPDCSIDPYDPVGDKVITFETTPGDDSEVTFIQNGSSYNFTTTFVDPGAGNPQDFGSSISYYINIVPSSTKSFSAISLSSSLRPGDPGDIASVTKRIFLTDINGVKLATPFAVLTNSGSVAIPSIPYNTTRLFIEDVYSSTGAGQVLSFTNSFSQYQRTPAPLPLFGAAAAFGVSRRLRRRALQSKLSR